MSSKSWYKHLYDDYKNKSKKKKKRIICFCLRLNFNKSNLKVVQI